MRVFLFLFAVLMTLDSQARAAEFVRTRVLMGDVPVTLTIDAKTSRRDRAFAAMDAAFAEAKRLEDSLSEWRPQSQATRLNRNAGKALVPVDREMMDLLRAARAVSEHTDGAFDITFASCKGKASLHRMAPLAGCPYDYRDVVLLPELGLAYLRPGVKIGVSGIAKGTIVDTMVGVLRRAGFRRFLVNAGDLYAAGRWTVGIRDPSHPGGNVSVAEVTVTDKAISTSGLYERGDHIVDPKTRRTPHGLRSATAIATTSQEADALAKAFFVLGKERSSSVLEGLPDAGGIFIDRTGGLTSRLPEREVTLRALARP